MSLHDRYRALLTGRAVMKKTLLCSSGDDAVKDGRSGRLFANSELRDGSFTAFSLRPTRKISHKRPALALQFRFKENSLDRRIGRGLDSRGGRTVVVRRFSVGQASRARAAEGFGIKDGLAWQEFCRSQVPGECRNDAGRCGGWLQSNDGASSDQKVGSPS